MNQSTLNNDKIVLPTERIRLLIVDDEVNILNALKRLFNHKPFLVHVENNGFEAMIYLENNVVDIIISDMRMPTMDGLDFLKETNKIFPEIKKIILSAYSDTDSILPLINDAHIYSFVQKPWDDLDLKHKVVNAAKELYLERINAHQKDVLKNWNETLEKVVEQRTKELAETIEALQKAYDELDKTTK